MIEQLANDFVCEYLMTLGCFHLVSSTSLPAKADDVAESSFTDVFHATDLPPPEVGGLPSGICDLQTLSIETELCL